MSEEGSRPMESTSPPSVHDLEDGGSACWRRRLDEPSPTPVSTPPSVLRRSDGSSLRVLPSRRLLTSETSLAFVPDVERVLRKRTRVVPLRLVDLRRGGTGPIHLAFDEGHCIRIVTRERKLDRASRTGVAGG